MTGPLIGVQQGIPVEYLNLNESFSYYFFSNEPESALKEFQNHRQTEALLLRASFKADEKVFQALSELRAFCLVSTGVDNVPFDLLEKYNVSFYSAAGANARAVRDYVIEALLELYSSDPLLMNRRVGIIGCGRTGSQLRDFLEDASIANCFYDPFIAHSSHLSQVLESAVLSFHVPLTRSGPHATAEMLSEEYFQNNSPLIIQTSRGGIWHLPVYERFLEQGLIYAQDVYPHEPPPARYIEPAVFSTPHIAGYSAYGRLGGIKQVLEKAFKDVGLPGFSRGEVWSLKDESDRFKTTHDFTARRDTFSLRKEFRDFSEAEQKEFRKRFRALPDNLLDAVFRRD